jgi:hypothetical protein
MKNQFTQDIDMAMYIRHAYCIWSDGACNTIAIVNFIKRFVDAYKDQLGSTELAKHPVMRLALAQLAYLSGIGNGETGLSFAEMEEIERIAKGDFLN